MDSSDPLSVFGGSPHLRVLTALWHQSQPQTGRAIARAVAPHVSRPTVEKALSELLQQGAVIRLETPPSILWSLERDHVVASVVSAAVNLRETLFERMRHAASLWDLPPEAAAVFGSTARGDGDTRSDVDILIVYPTDRILEVAESQDSDFADRVESWSGNRAQLLRMTSAQFRKAKRLRLPILAGIETDAVWLAGQRIGQLMQATA